MSDRESRKSLHVGGQAVIEGVMMRSPTRMATAVRRPNGEIVVNAEDYVSLTRRHRLLGFPIVRGAVSLVETFVLAVKALSFSSDHAIEEEGEGPPEEVETGKERSGVGALQMTLTVLAAIALGFALFFWAPLKLTEWIGVRDGIVFNLVDGAFRLLFIFLYVFLITRWREMQRIFEYHGAEHKTIYAFEEHGEIEPGVVAGYPRLHPRCSTSFLLIVVLVSIVVFIFLGRPEGLRERIIRFSFIPLIGGLSYEALRLSARPGVKRWLGFLFWPGLLLQRFTTREPAPDQIEVAIAALRACLSDKVLES